MNIGRPPRTQTVPRRTTKPDRVSGQAGPQPTRLNRFLSMCGIASRRKADDLILGGHVSINDRITTDLGVKITPGVDRVFVDGAEASAFRSQSYLVLNKPKDTITTLSDEKGRRTVIDLVRTRQRVYPVGRLDRHTTGVLILTSDGEFANQLMHPRFGIPKTYHVRCDKSVSREHMQQIRRGMQLPDGMTSAATVRTLPGGKGKEVSITVHEGRNRQVRRMFEQLGYSVKALDRVSYGPITYEGLSRGAVRQLSPREILSLRRIAEGSNRSDTSSRLRELR